jgi:NitT/TauT family transport system ATP-binding protein
MPWRTVLQNIELPLEIAGKSPRKHRVRTMELLDLVGLSGSENAYPNELSGGMRQRVSIARALIGNPRVLLMDEPFGALDEIVRDRLNDEIRRIWKETKLTILFVTHSIYEAAYLGERVLVLSANPGRVRDIVPVPLPYERTLEARETPEFVSLAARLRRTLETC